ncbi:MAG: hypothetical protein NXI25_08405 [bacterium]|nr:hypothetical protein [bacterium]
MNVKQIASILFSLLNPSKRNIFFPAAAFVFLLGCNKTADFEDLDLLTQKDWHLTSRVQGGTALTDDCDLDDVLVFTNATGFDYNFGDLICGDSSFVKDADTWKIIDDFTVLRMKYRFKGSGKGTIIEYWKILELNDTLLLVEDALAEGNDQVPEIRTYQH